MDLINQIMLLSQKLDKALHNIPTVARDYAVAESKYRSLLAETVLRLEAEGRPVTNLQIIARGKKDVAQAKIEQVTSEALYKATLEAINVYKLQIKILQSQVEKEWSNE